MPNTDTVGLIVVGVVLVMYLIMLMFMMWLSRD